MTSAVDTCTTCGGAKIVFYFAVGGGFLRFEFRDEWVLYGWHDLI